ncbi:hypothetical protein A0H81_05897 [Grifola frondosa]|uniref:Uncharacterized protein n=1 Tax=Grifola frondosa TaxID=5627 RepID=A0A1C7MFL0_GRIFR|nr:hypothetical protein A0H81_05897 [Grifola frondosa]
MAGSSDSDLPPQFSDDDRDTLRIQQNRLYIHKVLRVNYTTYDMRRAQDSINPSSHPDVMMLAPSGDPHPFMYTRILTIFHVNVYRSGPDLPRCPEPKRYDILWARSFDLDETQPGGFDTKRLHRLKFTDCRQEDAFMFLDPQQILRGAHLIPAFQHGHTDESLPGYSIARQDEEEDNDWKYFYVGM